MKKILVVLISTLLTVSAKPNENQLARFEKAPEENYEFNYLYELDKSNIFRGKTIFVHKLYYGNEKQDKYFYFLFVNEKLIKWVSFSQNELNSTTPLFKTVYPVDREDNNLHFEDDYYSFRIEFYDAGNVMTIVPISPTWDFENICFTKIIDGKNLYQYEIKSKTTGRMYSGKTFYEENQKSPFIQRIDLSNSWRDDYVVEIEFSEQEFNTTHKFCRGISRIVIIPVSLKEVITVENINPQVLKSLVG